MKNIKLVIGLLFIYSCAPVNTVNNSNNINTKPSASNTITSQPSSSTSSVPSLSPSSTSISPTPNPTPTPFKQINKMRVISDEGQIMIEKNFVVEEYYSGIPRYEYTNIFNSKSQFTGEIIYEDGTVSKDGLIWNVSDPDIASVDQTGLVTAKNIQGKTTVNISLKDNSSEVLKFDMYMLESLNYTYKDDDCIDNKTVTRTIKAVRDKYRYLGTQPYTGEFDGGCYPDISTLATLNGKVYDLSNVPVEGATVNAKSIDSGVNWTGEAQLTTGGAYVFRNAPVGTRLLITVTKDGWTTRSRSEVLKSNLNDDPTANVFNFGGTGIDVLYAIQDEPEVTSLKINSREVTSAAAGDSLNLASAQPFKPTKPTSDQLSEISGAIPSNVVYLPSLTGVATDNLAIGMTFSEPVRRDDIQNNFRVISQSVFSSTPDNKKPFIDGKSNPNFPQGESVLINKDFPGSSFTWSDNDSKVIFKTNKPILSNNKGQESRYIIDFDKDGFRDKNGKSARVTKQFRFSDSQSNDYTVFSVSNK